jgi:molybdopterin synthase catalytic subunit
MRVRVRLFAIQRELAGTAEVGLDLDDGATIDDAWRAVEARFPAIAPGRPFVRFARNSAYSPAETALADGDEVAFIPPVSGGSGEEADRAAEVRGRVIELRAESFDAGILAELADRLALPEDGAVAAFLGITRSSPGTPAPGQEAAALAHAGRRVEALDYEAHESMALAVIAEIADEIEARFGVTRVAIVHRTGSVPLGEPSVAIVACSPHRAAAFDAARYAIDETKARAPIWKAERFEDGKVWIGEPARETPGTGTTPAQPSSAPHLPASEVGP